MRRKKTEKKQFYIGDIFRVIGLIIAFSVLLYPTVSNYLYEKNGSKVISAYDENAVRLSESDKREMLEAARQYNEELLGNIELLDPFSSIKKEVDERYQSLLNVNGSGMIGYIRIPKINAELPIYHGTEEKVLQSGVGHFEGTSLPIGGESTHAVLTGHRGLPSKLLFTDLDNLEKGDIFYIKVLGETFAYQVDQILTVLPENTKELTIVPGKDYVTLVTCTPYAVNTHRLLVRGYRIPYEEAVEKVPDEKIAEMLGIVFGVLFLLIFVIQFGFASVMIATGNLDQATGMSTPFAYQIAALLNGSMMFIQSGVMIAVPILLWTRRLKREKSALGLPSLSKHGRAMILGLAIGAGSMTLTFLLLLVTDSAQVLTWVPQLSPSLLVMLILYILVGYSEEIICIVVLYFRGNLARIVDALGFNHDQR